MKYTCTVKKKMQCFFKMPCLIQCKTWKNSTWGWVNNVWIFILGQTIPLRLGVCLNLVIMMQTELIKRGRWSSICRTQTCRQASACVRPLLPIKTLPEAFQPWPTVGQTATWRLLTFGLLLLQSLQREKDTTREERQDSVPSHTPVSLTSTCLECRWHVSDTN